MVALWEQITAHVRAIDCWWTEWDGDMTDDYVL